MRKRKLFLAAFMLFTTFNTVKAQIDIESMITSFVDTTELLVNNGRRMILQNVQNGNFEKVAEIYEFLNERTSPEYCVAFTYNEGLYIALLTQNWNNFLTRAEYFSVMTRMWLCYPVDRVLANALYSELINNASRLFENAMIANLTLEERMLLELYFYVIENGGADKIYNQMLRDFRQRYPRSRYNDFINSHLPSPFIALGMGFSLGAALNFPTEGLSNYFAPGTTVSVGMMDIYFNDFFIGIQMDIGSLRLRKDLPSQRTGYRHNLFENERLMYINAGLLGGYTLIRNGRFEISPFLYLGGISLQSNLYGDVYSDSEFHVFNTFFFGPGLRTEFNLLSFGMRDAFSGFSFQNRLNLRLDAGYNVPIRYNYIPARGNIFYTRMALVYWFGNF